MYIDIYIYIYTHMCAYARSVYACRLQGYSMQACIYVHVEYVCVYIYIHIILYIYIYIYIYTYVGR